MLALECGHSFEDNSLYQRISSDLNRCYSAADMSRNNQLGRMPFCPHSGCQRTVNGPHRYSSLMRQYLQRLEPFQKVKRNELLCRQFAIDEDLGSEKVNKLLEMLSESGTGQFYADLKSVIHLLLGKSYLVSGNLSEAESNLKIALSGERDNTWLHIEGLTCLGYLQLCGGRGEEIALQSIESASARSLELSIRYLRKASSSPLHDILKAEELFGRKTGHLTLASNKITDQLKKLQKRDADFAANRAVAERFQSTFVGTGQSAVPACASESPVTHPVFPTLPSAAPLTAKISMADCSLLHIAAASGNLPEV